ncbi:MAG: hypothetical protein BroJett011_33880 [Chloroflexota bacterium]|nr:MAG: hypothetical protein BroJett011_33880 [Chloroflexota bacterium]
MRQLNSLREVQIVDDEKVGPMATKCKCGAYRSIRIQGDKFIVDACPMYDLPHHAEKDWEVIGTGKAFDFEDEKERAVQVTTEW